MKKTDISKIDVTGSLESIFPNGTHIARTNVRLSDIKVDVLVLERTSQELSAITLGWRDWNHSVRLAAAYQLITSRVYLAIWHNSITEERSRILSDLGIGIISVGPDATKTKVKPEVLSFPKSVITPNGSYAKELRRAFA